jgi:hypothetical protein
MFLWARLVLEYLTTNMFLKKVEVIGAIDTLPRELRDLFVILHPRTPTSQANY